jgi:hypothetical protein
MNIGLKSHSTVSRLNGVKEITSRVISLLSKILGVPYSIFASKSAKRQEKRKNFALCRTTS